jgi:hypothetical protein
LPALAHRLMIAGMTDDATTLVQRCVATWTEPDAEARRRAVPVAGGAAAGAGLEFLVLDDAGRIRLDYQFIEG